MNGWVHSFPLRVDLFLLGLNWYDTWTFWHSGYIFGYILVLFHQRLLLKIWNILVFINQLINFLISLLIFFLIFFLFTFFFVCLKWFLFLKWSNLFFFLLLNWFLFEIIFKPYWLAYSYREVFLTRTSTVSS